jgi:hypothetical protein
MLLEGQVREEGLAVALENVCPMVALVVRAPDRMALAGKAAWDRRRLLSSICKTYYSYRSLSREGRAPRHLTLQSSTLMVS